MFILQCKQQHNIIKYKCVDTQHNNWSHDSNQFIDDNQFFEYLFGNLEFYGNVFLNFDFEFCVDNNNSDNN